MILLLADKAITPFEERGIILKAKFINLTPHTINLNDGSAIQSLGVARVSASFTEFNNFGVCQQVFGEVEGLPSPVTGTIYIVSGMVLSALNGARSDVVAPATGHPDTKRNDKGHIISVPGFVQ